MNAPPPPAFLDPGLTLTGSPPPWAVAAYAVGTLVLLWALNQVKGRFWVFALLVWPGTLAHELCHWLSGHLLGARPTAFTVWPRRQGRTVQLGAVAFARLRWYNAFFVGMAPLVLLAVAYASLRLRLGNGAPLGPWDALGVYLLANLLLGAVPSGQDLRVAARSPVGWLLFGAGLVWGWRHRPVLPGRMTPVTRPEAAR